MNIAVIGTGYVGLITGVCLADLGMNVICADKNENTINNLKKFNIPIYEPGLEALIIKNYLSNKLHFTTNTKEAIENSDTIFICVGTPSLDDGSVDLKYINQAADEIANCINSYKLIIIKSTVPVGTCRHVKNLISDNLKKAGRNIEFDVASNPEFLREGCAVNDFSYPDRIVIGTDSEKAAMLMKDIYNKPIFENTPLIFTKFETSEMIKYASNAFLATKISYINEIANICDLCGADISIVARAMGLDKRIGESFLKPGPGFGGSCFPKDTKAIIHIGQTLGYKPEIIESVVKSNQFQREIAVRKIINAVGEVENKTFTLLGLAFKPDTADIRESSSIYIIEELLKKGGIIKAYDPQAMSLMKSMYPEVSVKYCDDELTACEESDCIIFATEWGQFQALDFTAVKDIVRNPVVIDLRNMFEPSYIKDKGFLYTGMGRQ